MFQLELTLYLENTKEYFLLSENLNPMFWLGSNKVLVKESTNYQNTVQLRTLDSCHNVLDAGIIFLY